MQRALRDMGTRFRLFPQAPFLHPELLPEIVQVTRPPGAIGPGPADDRIYVIDPVGKGAAYGLLPELGPTVLYLPPWSGSIRPPVRPGPDGHFDHIAVGTPDFALAHLYGTTRFVMDVWERYLGGEIPWHFSRHFPRLEITILPTLDNARAGYGYMEVGEHPNDDGSIVPYALNFDVIAHELGHLIIYGTIGVPNLATGQGEYFGFHESAADMTALIASLHFASMVDRLLDQTRGNLYALNELNRFAELSTSDQIRLASNSATLSQFAAGWDDEHDLSQPLTGALFDSFVDIFQELLVERGLIARAVADLSDLVGAYPSYLPAVQTAFDAAYPGRARAFRQALFDARDYLGFALAEVWKRLSPHFLTYAQVGDLLIAVDQAMSGGRYHAEIYESFAWRDIGSVKVGPRLTPPDEASHAVSVRALVPAEPQPARKLSYLDRVLLTKGVI